LQKLTAEQLIQLLDLQPLPVEGGYFRETFRSAESLPAAALPRRYTSARPFGSAIYYLLTSEPDCFSTLHKLPTDEVYHFYLGDPIDLLLLHPDGRSELVILGPDVLTGQQVQFVVPRDVWQGSRLIPGGNFALLGTTLAPAFDPSDFVSGHREELLRLYPAQAALIRLLTRS
jgi:predicted cupin superfamily sugar epimerase